MNFPWSTLAIFIIELVNVINTDVNKLTNVNCEMKDYSLENTLAIGLVDNEVFQYTIQHYLISYKKDEQLLLSGNGTALNIISLLNEANKIDQTIMETINYIVALKEKEILINKFSFNILPNIGNKNELLAMQIIDLDNNLKLITKTNTKSQLNMSTNRNPFEWIISIWSFGHTKYNHTGHTGLFLFGQLMNDENQIAFYEHEIHRNSSKLNFIAFVCHEKVNEQFVLLFESERCSSSRQVASFFKLIRFAFVFKKRIHLISLKQNQIYTMDNVINLFKNENITYYPITNMEIEKLFPTGCIVYPEFINWKFLITLILSSLILIFVVLILCNVFNLGTWGKKDLPKKRKTKLRLIQSKLKSSLRKRQLFNQSRIKKLIKSSPDSEDSIRKNLKSIYELRSESKSLQNRQNKSMQSLESPPNKIQITVKQFQLPGKQMQQKSKENRGRIVFV